MVELSSKNTNKTKGIKIGNDFTVIITDIDSAFKKETACKIYDISEDGNFKVREKEPCYIGFTDDNQYYRTFRVQLYSADYNVISGFYFFIIKPCGYSNVILRGHFEEMITKGEVKSLIPEEAWKSNLYFINTQVRLKKG